MHIFILASLLSHQLLDNWCEHMQVSKSERRWKRGSVSGLRAVSDEVANGAATTADGYCFLKATGRYRSILLRFDSQEQRQEWKRAIETHLVDRCFLLLQSGCLYVYVDESKRVLRSCATNMRAVASHTPSSFRVSGREGDVVVSFASPREMQEWKFAAQTHLTCAWTMIDEVIPK